MEHTVGLKLSNSVVHLAAVLSSIIYATHVISCAYCLFGIREIHFSDEISWIDANNLGDEQPLQIYLQAYYWTLYTIAAVGYGNISVVSNGEKLFAMCVMVMGSIMVCNTVHILFGFYGF